MRPAYFFACALLAATSSADAQAPDPPSALWLSTPAIPQFEVQINVGGNTGNRHADCPAEYPLCITVDDLTRPEIFFAPPEPGYFWPAIVKFNTAPLEVWIRYIPTQTIRYYNLSDTEYQAEKPARSTAISNPRAAR